MSGEEKRRKRKKRIKCERRRLKGRKDRVRREWKVRVKGGFRR